MINRSWCEINLLQLQENFRLCKEKLACGCEIIAVVKADGHGAIPIARALQRVGCKNFAVSNLAEGIALRNSGVDGQILILGYTPPHMISSVKNNGLCQVVYSPEYAEAIIKENKSINVQIAVDTGMNRIGFRWENIREIIHAINKLCERCKVVGIYTHLACADEKGFENFTDLQIERFKSLLKSLESFDFSANKHFSNSACFLNGGKDLLNYTRLGICLYGLGENLFDGIKPILKWKSVVVMVKRVKEGEGIGYGLTYTPQKDSIIATVATGYADGLSLALSNLGRVEIKGRLVPIVGRICMDVFMVDVSELVEVALGEEVVLVGEKYGVNDVANDLKTIPYEVVCSISKRVPRIYFDER